MKLERTGAERHRWRRSGQRELQNVRRACLERVVGLGVEADVGGKECFVHYSDGLISPLIVPLAIARRSIRFHLVAPGPPENLGPARHLS